MGHAADDVGGGELLDDGEVAAVGAHQRRTGLVLQLVDVVVGVILCHLEEQLARQRVAVGVQAVRGQAEEDVTDLDGFAGNDAVAVDRADDGAGEVVLAVGVEAGHLRRLAADQGAAVGAAGLADALHDGLDDLVVELAGGQVIEKEERRGALHGDVVDAVVDEVLAYGVVDAQLEGDLELGADAVGRRDQDGVGKFFEIEREQAAEAADLREHMAVEGLARQHLDALLAAVGAGDVDPGVGVADALLGGGDALDRGLGVAAGLFAGDLVLLIGCGAEGRLRVVLWVG